MESMASTVPFHGFPRPSHSLKVPQTDVPTPEPKDIRARNRRKSRKHQRFLLHKSFLQKRGLREKNKSEGRSSSSHEEGSFSSCSQRNGANQLTRLEEMKASLSALPTSLSSPPASDYDSGLSVASSCPSSRASSPSSWLKPGKCVALDCEMVGTGPGAKISKIGRCSVVNYRGEVIYDKYIKPDLPITDYRTRWSGITRRHMVDAIPFKTAQEEIMKLLKGKLVIGHAVHNDLAVLEYFHPSEQIRDTSRIPLLNHMAGFPPRPSVSLKRLAFHILRKEIQVGKRGHSSVEDAQTCMELFRLVEDEVEQVDLSDLDEDSEPDDQYMDDQYWPSDLKEDCK
ncbi:apoptosis-enhancing nuclease [Eleutherodactylus coqui]